MWLKDLPQEKLKKILALNDEMRTTEFRLRKAFSSISTFQNSVLEKNIIDDFEYEFQYSLYSNNLEFCKLKDALDGDPFYQNKFFSNMLEDEEYFNMNWGESFDEEYPICYIMHDLLYHSNLSIDDILEIDLFWIDIKTYFQIFKRMNQKRPLF